VGLVEEKAFGGVSIIFFNVRNGLLPVAKSAIQAITRRVPLEILVFL
jgi:hypothetical protein